jgi:Rrf2 family transcriptional regulator, iron-sulfur cluster assembly transcription factor
MHVSTAGHHAVQIMLDLAIHGQDAPVSRQDISGRLDISCDYIAQLTGRLHKAGLVESVMGPGGGYMLARPASQVRVGDIIRAIDGPIETRYCVAPDPEGSCSHKETCLTHGLWVDLSMVIDAYLNGITLQNLCDRAPQLEHITFSGFELT